LAKGLPQLQKITRRNKNYISRNKNEKENENNNNKKLFVLEFYFKLLSKGFLCVAWGPFFGDLPARARRVELPERKHN